MCHYPLPRSFSPPLFLFALFPSPLPFHKPVALRLSNKSHLIVHFLSWPGAWCQTSCMKCSFTALPASTFVQRKNNKKSHRASWTLWGFFSLPFEEEAKQPLIHCLFYCHVPLKEYSNRLLSLHEKTSFFSHDWKSRVSVWLFMDCYCLKK